MMSLAEKIRAAREVLRLRNAATTKSMGCGDTCSCLECEFRKASDLIEQIGISRPRVRRSKPRP